MAMLMGVLYMRISQTNKSYNSTIGIFLKNYLV
jgi:hypothetical protein